MSKIKLLLTVLLCSISAYSYAEESLLTGNAKLACEAILCLAAPNPSGIKECAEAIATYEAELAISAGAAAAFLALCPKSD